MAININEQISGLQEIVALLRQQVLLATDCLKKFKDLKYALQHSTSGAGVTAAVQALEPALKEMSGLYKRQAAYLTRAQHPRMTDALNAQPHSAERDVAVRLLQEAQALASQLREEISSSEALLDRSKKYIDFNVNFMSGASASTTYAPPGAGMGEVQRERKIFDANV